MTRKLITRSVPYIAAAVLALSGVQAFGEVATINPIADNTMASDFDPDPNADPVIDDLQDNSSGLCDSVFAGTTDIPAERRTLLQFDVSSIPPGSIITDVTLSMTVTRGAAHDPSDFQLHRVTSAWAEGVEGCGARGGGQGEPTTGGATWNDAVGGVTAWGTPGGDYDSASASTTISDSAPVWSSAGLVSDVQDWVNGDVPNYGWVIIGVSTAPKTTRRFDSREGGAPPQLVVVYTPDPNAEFEACCTPEGDCSLTVVDSGSCVGTTEPTESCSPNPCQQPTGACCNADVTCSDDVDRLICEENGGAFQGKDVKCNAVSCGLTPFFDPLPIPGVLAPDSIRADGVPQYTVSVERASQFVHSEMENPTDLWTYNGAWPASTIVATKGQPIEVTYQNNLPSGTGGNRGNNILEVDTCAHGPNEWGKSKRIVTHLHGGHVPARVDGQPEYHLLPGDEDIYEYPNNQDAGTVWYHDHALGITRLNVYGGMAGFYLIREEKDPNGATDADTLGPDNDFGLPSGQYEIGLAIQDRSFNEDGSLFYNAELEDAFKGDKLLVNGKITPFLNVDQGKYRFRILNGSQSREYSLRLENITDPDNDPVFTLVGTDLGLVSAPIDLVNGISIMAPAERMDVVVDFAGMSAGDEIILRNDDPTPPYLPNVMKFIVTGQPGYTGAIRSTLRPVAPMLEGSENVTRYFRLAKYPNQDCKDSSGRLVNEWLVESLDGPDGTVTGKYWDDLREFPILGTREIWEFENPTSVMHPMHVHLVRFQILSKTDANGVDIPLEDWEKNTWKDIVRIPPGATARIIMDFEDYLGRFPQHCHVLDHEDHEMMRQFQTINDPLGPEGCGTLGTCTPGNGICEVGEDCNSVPGDCSQVSGALCGNGLCEAGDDENCVSCPEDCAGKQKGKEVNQFCCGFDDGKVTNPVLNGCGIDADDNRCIDATANLFCRKSDNPRLSACCGDALCEGQENVQGTDFCQIDCNPGPSPVCSRNAPAFNMGGDQSIAVDGSAVYTLSVTNNDTAACADTTFDLSIFSETGDTGSFSQPSVLSAASVTVASGANDTSVTLTVTGNGSGANGDLLDSTVEASDDANHAGQQQTDTVRTTIQAAVCTYTDPTVSISPNTQDVTTDGGSAGYTVNIANNDTAACADTTFNLSVSDSNGVDFDPSTLAQNPVNLAPGENTDVALTVTGQAGASNGTSNVSSVATDADANHGIATSSTVTTTINVGVVVCEDILTRTACKDEPTCQWKKNDCITR